MKKLLPILSLMSLVSVLLAGPASPTTLITNPDFETGSLDGWSVRQGRNGSWDVYSGTPDFCSGPARTPAGGTYSAAVDQGGPGVHILHQVIYIPGNTDPLYSVSLVLKLAYRSTAPFEPKRNFLIGHPRRNHNHQFRIDLMDPTAPLKSLDKADLWMSYYRTRAGDPKKRPWTDLSKDVTALQGQSVRLRIVEVDNQGCLNVMVDDFGFTAIL